MIHQAKRNKTQKQMKDMTLNDKEEMTFPRKKPTERNKPVKLMRRERKGYISAVSEIYKGAPRGFPDHLRSTQIGLAEFDSPKNACDTTIDSGA
jgi:hypothetical protein